MNEQQWALLIYLQSSPKFNGKSIFEMIWMLGQESPITHGFNVFGMSDQEQLDVLLILVGERIGSDGTITKTV